jgi:PAS domain S-box-containing protein
MTDLRAGGSALGRVGVRLARWHPLALTLAVVGAATLLRAFLDQLAGGLFPFLAFLPAVVVCALVAGWRWGAVAAALSTVLAVAMSGWPVSTGMLAGTVAFVALSGVLIWLTEMARRARYRAEAEAGAAQESERRFNVMADSVPLMIWITDVRGRVMFVNRAWEEFFGITQEDVRRNGWQPLVHPDDRIAYVNGFMTSLRERIPFDATARVRRADGEWRWVESCGVPRTGGRGELLSYGGTSIDVTERRALEMEREVLLESERAARMEAENATRAKDEFLATLSHELRTPLSVIVLWSRILARKYGSGEEDLRKGLALIIDNGMALSQLIGDLLDMSRIVSGRVTLDSRPIDVAELVNQAVSSHRPAADAKRITLSLELGPEPKIVLGDPTRLQQVLWNLLANAVKFTPEKGHIWVAARREGGRVLLTVRDDGEGIAPEFLPQVFSRFRQADSSSTRRHGGLGLGLAIVKQIVELHGGDVQASSRGAGLGSAFTVTLPLLEAAVPDIDSSGSWRRLDPDRALVPRLEGRRVLAVEDQRDMLDSLRHMLEEQGAVVTAVTSGVEAYALLRAGGSGYDVLLSDIGMPQMDGYDLIRRVRGELGLPPHRLPAVAITAYARDEDRERALQAGFQAHLVKPYQVGQLVAILNQLHASPGASRDAVAPSLREKTGASVAS